MHESVTSSCLPGRDRVGIGPHRVGVDVACVEGRPDEREVLARRLVPGWPAGALVPHDGLGRPLSVVPGHQFSLARLRRAGHAVLTCGAACGHPAVRGLGIDAACGGEFEPGYPVERVFRPLELEALRPFLGRVGHEWSEVMAAAWACKEAAVKALGSGFHHFEPLDVTVQEVRDDGCDVALRVQARRDNRSWIVDSVLWPQAGVWIAVAVSLEDFPARR